MQLHVARLCMDCDEIHDSQSCPVCGSETYAYLKRWVPAPERREEPRPPSSSRADVYRQLIEPAPANSRKFRLLKGGAIGIAAFALGRWLRRPR